MIDRNAFYTGNSRYNFDYCVLVFALMVVLLIATGCGGGGGDGSPGERSIAKENKVSFSIDVSSDNSNNYSYETAKVSIAGVEKETFYDIQIRDEQIKGSGSIKSGNSVEIILDIESIVDSDLYVVIFDCPENTANFCNIANPIRIVLTGEKLKQGGYTATLLTELAYQKIAYYVNTGFSPEEIKDVLDGFSNGLFKNEFRLESDAYENLLLAWSPTENTKLARSDVILEFENVISSKTEKFQLQSFLGKLQDPRINHQVLAGYGSDIRISGDIAYLRTDRGELQVFRISDSINPAVISSIKLDQGKITNFTVFNQLIYALSPDALEVFDVADPINPQSISRVVLNDEFSHLHVRDEELILLGTGKMAVLDTADLDSYAEISGVKLGWKSMESKLQHSSLFGDRLLLVSNMHYYLYTINSERQAVIADSISHEEENQICTDGNVELATALCIYDYYGGDISESSEPKTSVTIQVSEQDELLVSEQTADVLPNEKILDLDFYQGNYIVSSVGVDYWLGNWQANVRILDASDAAQPPILVADNPGLGCSFLEVDNERLYCGGDFFVGLYALGGNTYEGTVGFDIYDLAEYPELEKVELEKSWKDGVDKMLVYENYGYALLRDGSIAIVDISDIEGSRHPKSYFPVERSSSENNQIIDFTIVDDMAYLVTNDSNFIVLDLKSDPKNPIVVGRLQLQKDGDLKKGESISVSNGMAYVAFGYYGFGRIDITNPSSLELDFYVDPNNSRIYPHEVTSILASDDKVYIGIYDGIKVYQNIDKSTLKLLDTIQIPSIYGEDMMSAVEKIELYNDVLYFLLREEPQWEQREFEGGSQLGWVNVSEQRKLEYVFDNKIDEVKDFLISEDTLYAKLAKGVALYDVSASFGPSFRTEYKGSLKSSFFALSKDYIYLGGGKLRPNKFEEYASFEVLDIDLLRGDKFAKLVDDLPITTASIPMLFDAGAGYSISDTGNLVVLDIPNSTQDLSAENYNLYSARIDEFFVVGSYVYAAHGDTIEIFDYSDFDFLLPVARFKLDSEPGENIYVEQFLLVENYLYLLTPNDIRIINIENPESPRAESRFLLSDSNSKVDILYHSVSSKDVYASSIDAISVIDVSNPSLPLENYPSKKFKCNERTDCRDTVVVESPSGESWLINYATHEGVGLYSSNDDEYVFDYEGYWSPVVEVDTFDHYVIAGNGGDVNIYDTEHFVDDTTLVTKFIPFVWPVSSLDLGDDADVTRVNVAGDFAFVADRYNYHPFILDISDVKKPFLVDVQLSDSVLSQTIKDTAQKDIFLARNYKGDLVSLNLTDDDAAVSRLFGPFGVPVSYAVKNNNIYMVDRDKLNVANVDSGNGELVLTEIDTKMKVVSFVALRDYTLYVLGRDLKFDSDAQKWNWKAKILMYRLYDGIRHPTYIDEVSLDRPANRIEIVGGFVYAIDDNNIQVFSIEENGVVLTKRISYATSFAVNSVARVGAETLFATDMGIQFGKFENGPNAQAFVPTVGVAVDMAVDKGYAYVADTKAGLLVLDIQNMSAPQLSYVVGTKGVPRSVHVDSDTGHVVLHTSYGVEVLRTVGNGAN